MEESDLQAYSLVFHHEFVLLGDELPNAADPLCAIRNTGFSLVPPSRAKGADQSVGTPLRAYLGTLYGGRGMALWAARKAADQRSRKSWKYGSPGSIR